MEVTNSQAVLNSIIHDYQDWNYKTMKDKMKKLLLAMLLLVMTSTTAFADVVTGSCGENATYSYDTGTGIISIEGSGRMSDYDYGYVSGAPHNVTTAPWRDYYNSGDDNTPSKLKYWFDNQTTSSTLSLASGTYNLDATGLDDGFHTLCCQIVCKDGSLGPATSSFFLKVRTNEGSGFIPKTIRYWYDAQTVIHSTAYQENCIIDASMLDDGFHILCYQVSDGQGHYSPVCSSFFLCVRTNGESGFTPRNIRYWFDSDAEIRTIDYQESCAIDATTLDEGFHTLCYQLSDGQGNLSPVTTAFFMRLRSTEEGDFVPTGIRYWFDTEKNVQQTSYQLDCMIDASSLDEGFHTFCCQLTDGKGHLSPVRTTYFMRIIPAEREAGVPESIIYWVDDQYSLATTVSYSEAVTLHDLEYLPEGEHTISYQVITDKDVCTPVRSCAFTCEFYDLYIKNSMEIDINAYMDNPVLAESPFIKLYYDEDTLKNVGHLHIDPLLSLSLGKFSQSIHLGNYNETNTSAYLNYSRHSTLINEGYMRSDSVLIELSAYKDRWHFFSMPFNVKVADLSVPEGVYWTIREYDGEERAHGNSDDTWKSLNAQSMIEANRGYILQFTMADANLIHYDTPAKTSYITDTFYKRDQADMKNYDYKDSCEITTNHIICIEATKADETVGPAVAMQEVEVGSDSIVLTFTPNDAVSTYHCCMFGVGELETQFDMFREWAGFTCYGDMIKTWGYHCEGKQTKVWNDLEPNTTYEIYVQPLNVEGDYGELQCFTVTTYVDKVIFYEHKCRVTKFVMPAVNDTKKNQIFTSGDYSVDLKEHIAEFEHNRSWNFVGNPYPSFYDTRMLESSNPITVWTGTTYKAVSPEDDDYVLAPFEAFFIQRPVDKDVLIFQKEGRQDSPEASQMAALAPRRALRNSGRQIYNLALSDTAVCDECRIVINDNAHTAYEVENDAVKFMSDNAAIPQIYSEHDGIQYAINERPFADGLVALSLRIPSYASYTIGLSSTRNTDLPISLIDLETNTITNLEESNYTFTANEGILSARMIVYFGEVLGIDAVQDKLRGSIEVFDINGKRCYRGRKSLEELSLSAGVYIVRSKDATYKIIIK